MVFCNIINKLFLPRLSTIVLKPFSLKMVKTNFSRFRYIQLSTRCWNFSTESYSGFILMLSLSPMREYTISPNKSTIVTYNTLLLSLNMLSTICVYSSIHTHNVYYKGMHKYKFIKLFIVITVKAWNGFLHLLIKKSLLEK